MKFNHSRSAQASLRLQAGQQAGFQGRTEGQPVPSDQLQRGHYHFVDVAVLSGMDSGKDAAMTRGPALGELSQSLTRMRTVTQVTAVLASQKGYWTLSSFSGQE